MTVLGALARRSGNPESPLTPLAMMTGEALFGTPSKAGVPVTERTVYGLTAWYRAVALLAGVIAALPLHTYRLADRERSDGYVLDQPNPTMTPFEFWQTMVANASTWGTGYARKIYNRGGVVIELWPLHPSMVEVRMVPRSDANPAGKVFVIHELDGTVETLTSYEVFELPYLSIDGRIGLRPLALFRDSLGAGLAAEQSAASFFANGAQLAGVLETDAELDEQQAKARKARFKEKVTGPGSAGDIVVLDRGMKYSPLAVPPKDAELLTSRKFTVTEIARLFGIPPHMLGDIEKSSSWGTGIEQQMIGFVQFTLLPWLRLIEQRCTYDLLPGGWSAGRFYAQYNVEGLLRGDSKARAEFYRTLIQWGVITPNEARRKENLEPLDGLDFTFVPKNMTVRNPGKDDPLDLLDLTRALQQIYLAVGKVITQEEARELLNRGGAGFDLGTEVPPLPTAQQSAQDQGAQADTTSAAA